MIRPRGSSLRFKVVLVIFLASAIALALACAAFVAYEYSSVRSRIVSRLDALAAIVGENCKAALVFADSADAERTLAGLHADPRITAAALYGANGQRFAQFARHPADASFPSTPPTGGATFSAQRVAVARPILQEGRVIGNLYLVGDSASFEDQFREFARAGGTVLFVALLVAALLAYRLQRIITDPVLRLVAAASTVAESQDLAVRVDSASRDELGLLTDTFNHMLAQIERRNTALRASETRYALAVQGARDGLWDWNLETREFYAAPRFKEMIGEDDAGFAARPEAWLDRIHPEDRNGVHAALEAHLSGAAPHFEAEYRLRHRDGSWVWAFARGVAIRDPSGRAVRMAGSQSDVTERKGRDAGTGLPNRVLLLDRIDSALRWERSPDGRPFALMVVAVERYELILETLGAGAGRLLLAAAAERIRLVLRERDTLASLEGGLFAVLLELRHSAQASRLAKVVHAALAPPFTIADQEHFSASAIGIALSNTGYDTAEEVLRDAMTALARARERGLNQSELFDEHLRLRAIARLELEDALRRALDRGELKLHYQPIFTLQGRQLAGFEALVRWERTPGEFTPPAEFIGLAEETGIIVPLGRWVLGEACRQLKQWRAACPGRPDLALSVNISAQQLARLELLEEVESALGDAGLPPHCLKLEITESLLLEHLEPAVTILHRLQESGVGLWLDDFGTGYSNLSYLHRFPIEAIKIDRSFVSRLDAGGERHQIAHTLVSLARSLGLKSIGEGVETALQLERLDALGCDLAQGYAISEALDAEAAGELVRVAAVGSVSR